MLLIHSLLLEDDNRNRGNWNKKSKVLLVTALSGLNEVSGTYLIQQKPKTIQLVLRQISVFVVTFLEKEDYYGLVKNGEKLRFQISNFGELEQKKYLKPTKLEKET